MGEPQHHAEAEVLVDVERFILPLDDCAHLGDLGRQLLRAEQAVGHIAVEGVHRAEAVAGVRRREVLLHLPDHAPAGQHERMVDVLRDADALLAIGGLVLAEAGQRVEPHGEIVEILPVAVSRFADAIAALSAKHLVDFRHQLAGIVEPAPLTRLAEEGDVEHKPEGVGPEVTQAIGPDTLVAHPVELVQHIIEVAPGHARGSCPTNV